MFDDYDPDSIEAWLSRVTRGAGALDAMLLTHTWRDLIDRGQLDYFELNILDVIGETYPGVTAAAVQLYLAHTGEDRGWMTSPYDHGFDYAPEEAGVVARAWVTYLDQCEMAVRAMEEVAG